MQDSEDSNQLNIQEILSKKSDKNSFLKQMFGLLLGLSIFYLISVLLL